MLTWILSDGTEVDLGGEVRGDSAFAQELRKDFAQSDLIDVQIGPHGCGTRVLDLSDPFLVDMHIRDTGLCPARPDKVSIVSGPKVEAPPIPDYEFNPDVLY